MDEGERAAPVVLGLVRRVEAREDVGHHARRNGDRDALAARARFPHEGREREAVDILHDDEELAVAGDEVSRRDHVGVPQARSKPRFVEQEGGKVGIADVLSVEALDGDDARKACVAP